MMIQNSKKLVLAALVVTVGSVYAPTDARKERLSSTALTETGVAVSGVRVSRSTPTIPVICDGLAVEARTIDTPGGSIGVRIRLPGGWGGGCSIM